MKFIIVGLGNFGASLAEKLTAEGNEVIGIDSNMTKVDSLKEKITHTICLNATDQFTMSGLPFKDTDVVIVAIGEDQGANIMVTALLKNLQVKRLISRAINPLHENVLEAIGVDEIVHPEEETAERWAKKLTLNGLVDSFELSSDYSIVEVEVPQQFVAFTVESTNIRAMYNLLILTIIKSTDEKCNVGGFKTVKKVQGVTMPNYMLEERDILVVFGANKDIKAFLNAQ